ncbi:alpha/beta hydrolase family protein [Nocardia sienata]|uniref:alpha/beta hydrolase family protein n=1 Tax=Nocardia sienata TaxID=248552 RepID=UPI000B1A2714
MLQVNFWGSLGYGRRHVTAAIGEFTRAMRDDLLDAVDWAVGQGFADPDRIGIYGGYAALVGITVTPDRFPPPSTMSVSPTSRTFHAPCRRSPGHTT